jgi:hypothetical protein
LSPGEYEFFAALADSMTVGEAVARAAPAPAFDLAACLATLIATGAAVRLHPPDLRTKAILLKYRGDPPVGNHSRRAWSR